MSTTKTKKTLSGLARVEAIRSMRTINRTHCEGVRKQGLCCARCWRHSWLLQLLPNRCFWPWAGKGQQVRGLLNLFIFIFKLTSLVNVSCVLFFVRLIIQGDFQWGFCWSRNSQYADHCAYGTTFSKWNGNLTIRYCASLTQENYWFPTLIVSASVSWTSPSEPRQSWMHFTVYRAWRYLYLFHFLISHLKASSTSWEIPMKLTRIMFMRLCVL